jgi:NitT/TauT family transport system substrate-binding protein
VGAWYETMAAISEKSKTGKNAVEYMANFAGGTAAEFKAQLRTTAMFYKAADAVAFIASKQLKQTMTYVRDFSFDHGLFGDAENKDVVGISFPDGTVLGSKFNVRLRFNATFMKLAADGKL